MNFKQSNTGDNSVGEASVQCRWGRWNIAFCLWLLKFIRGMEGIQNQHQKKHQTKEKTLWKLLEHGTIWGFTPIKQPMCWLIEDYSMSRGCFPEAACMWQPCLGDQLNFKVGHKLHRLLSKPGSKPIAVSWVQPQSLEQVCPLQFSLPPKDPCPAHLYSQACRMSVTLPTPSHHLRVRGYRTTRRYLQIPLAVRTACPECAHRASHPTPTAPSSLVSVQETSQSC